MKTKVIFEYDEPTGLWELFVQGATSELDALQAFNAVILTARIVTPKVEYNKATATHITNEYKISIGV